MKMTLLQWNNIVEALRTAAAWHQEQRDRVEGAAAVSHYKIAQCYLQLATDIASSRMSAT